MLQADRRVVVSHVGSLVRPPAMIPYLEKIRDKEPYDEAAFENCLTDSVAEAVRLQAEAGIDVVSDGEYGKSVNWAFYVHRRLSGLTWRPYTAEEARDPTIAVIGGRDREAFPEFYGEYDARVLANARAAGRAIVTGAITYTGTAELQRDIANLKAGLAKVKGVTGFLPVVAPASALPNAKTSTTAMRRRFCSASPRRSGPSIAPSSMPASTCRWTTRSSRTSTKRWCHR